MADQVGIALEFAAGTDIGCKRSNNEDSFGYDLKKNLYVVCDGIGGIAGGEIASGAAVRALIEFFNEESESKPESPVEERLHRAIARTHQVIRKLATATNQFSGMGTTLVCACLEGDRIVIANVGDSRAYFSRNGACFQVTQDHSLIADQLRDGIISGEQAAASEFQSFITRAVGVSESIEADVFAADLLPADMVLLASDGLTRYVSDQDLSSILHRYNDVSQACRALIQLAKSCGGADNITCIVLRAGKPELQGSREAI